MKIVRAREGLHGNAVNLGNTIVHRHLTLPALIREMRITVNAAPLFLSSEPPGALLVRYYGAFLPITAAGFGLIVPDFVNRADYSCGPVLHRGDVSELLEQAGFTT